MDDLKIKVVTTRSLENNPKVFIKLQEWLNRKKDPTFALYINMEPRSTNYEEAACDKINAAMLAQMGLERELFAWSRPDEKLRNLKRMSRERIGLIRDRNAMTNQLHALNHSHDAFLDSIERLNDRVSLATKQLGEIEEQMHAMVESDPQLLGKMKHVITIPRINFVTAMTVIA